MKHTINFLITKISKQCRYCDVMNVNIGHGHMMNGIHLHGFSFKIL